MHIADRLEHWLDCERDQLALWLPVALGTGIGAWFLIDSRSGWIAFVLAMFAGAAAALALLGRGRAGQAGATFLLLAGIGCLLIWWRAEWVSAPRLHRPMLATFAGRIEHVDYLSARDMVRLVIAPDANAALPPHIRVNVDDDDVTSPLVAGQRIRLRARLMPPPQAGLPGGYDYARVAWFQRIGATGRALGTIAIMAAAEQASFWGWVDRIRAELTAHIHAKVPGSAGGIAAAFVTGDQGAIAEDDVAAMRTSGLAHLLSISGLHVSAVVGGTMWLVLRVLALSPRLALRAPLPLIAAGAAAAAGIGYTLLAGAEVPTVRSCIAAILVIVALAIGREAMTLRLVAAGAMVVLLIRPEALVGPSFQLSFAAVTALIAFHDYPPVRRFALSGKDRPFLSRMFRSILLLVATGIAVEAALAPIGLYHFHRSGIYGSVANIIAIPLTTFVVMPAEALALLLDTIGMGWISWSIVDFALKTLIYIAHTVQSLPGATASLPTMPVGAYLLMAGSGIWLCLWRSAARLVAIVPFLAGAIWAASVGPPDILISGDGRHVAIRAREGMYLLRPRAGDYVRNMIASVSAEDEAGAFDDLSAARCNADLCLADLEREGVRWRLLATRSPYLVSWRDMIDACRQADIVVSDRRLPRSCLPRWIKIDRQILEKTGGMQIKLQSREIMSVRADRDDHPWLAISPASYPK